LATALLAAAVAPLRSSSLALASGCSREPTRIPAARRFDFGTLSVTNGGSIYHPSADISVGYAYGDNGTLSITNGGSVTSGGPDIGGGGGGGGGGGVVGNVAHSNWHCDG